MYTILSFAKISISKGPRIWAVGGKGEKLTSKGTRVNDLDELHAPAITTLHQAHSSASLTI